MTVEAAELELGRVSAPAKISSEGSLARRIVVAGSCVALVAAAVQTSCHLVDAFVLDGRYPALEADAQGNVFDWVSAAAILAAGVVAFVGAAAPASRLASRVLGVLLGYLAVDELVGIHERIGAEIATHLPGKLGELGDRVTPVIYLPILGAVFVLLLVIGGGRVQGGRLVRFGLALLAGAVSIRVAAAGVKLASGQVNGTVRTVGVAADQAFQLAAWVLIATGLASRLPGARKE